MVYIMPTKYVDALSVPFGQIIGPTTAVSNIIKCIVDVAQIAVKSFLNRNYTPSSKYTAFKRAEAAWEKNVSAKYKPQIDRKGGLRVTRVRFQDPQQFQIINTQMGKPVLTNYTKAYNNLSASDRRQVQIDSAKKNLWEHFTFIGVGVVRSVPVFGGLSRCAWNWYRG